MKPKHLFLPFLFILSFLIAKETKHKEIPLAGLITDPKQEISGLDWYGDNLVLLPENLGGFLFMISKDEIYASLNMDNPKPIKPRQTPFLTPDYSKLIPGFEGFESIAFNGNRFVITLEAKDGKKMHGYITWGTIDPNTLEAKISEQIPLELPMPVQVNNMTYESALIDGDNVILFYEANGKNIRNSAWQYVVSMKDYSVSKIDYPHIEYRITDVTRLDDKNCFWTINYFWPGDKKRVKPAFDPIAATFLKGETHGNSEAVERLVEFELLDGKIQLSNREPIQIELDENESRNWEGIVRLDEKGFLMVTDKFPGSLLGFIPIN
ncbi:MAG: hypothetical protein IIB95_01060 [Candidatus Marinimicrobia bacterium]|nr:hypothetical protein [Candidatus Neomarinimicrobiota bacterium]